MNALPTATVLDLTSAEPVNPTRWQPTRVGLINVWRYWDETFEFHNGRLLLRGPKPRRAL